MIALNEIINKKDEFEKQYSLRGKKIDLSYFLDAEKSCRTLQQQAELARADCNKLCANFINCLGGAGLSCAGRAGTETENSHETGRAGALAGGSQIAEPSCSAALTFKKIKILDRRAKKLQNKLQKLTNSVEKKLQKLPNAQINGKTFDLKISDSANAQLSAGDLEGFLSKNFDYKKYFGNSKMLLRSLSHFIMQEQEFPLCFKTTDKRFVILTRDYDFMDTVERLISFFKEHAINISELSANNLEKFVASAFLVQLSSGNTLTLKLINEYYSREFKIKYKNNSIDMTKFVAEIDIQL